MSYRKTKRLFDFTLALMLLPAVSLVSIFVMIAIKADTKGSAVIR